MNVCLIGNSLTNLVLAKILANKNIKVTIFYEPNRKNKFFSRTIGISKNNFDFFIDQILDIKKISWPIKSIKVFNELSLEDEILNFRDDNSRFLSIVKYNQLFKLLNKNVANNKYIKKYKIKNRSFYDTILKNNQFNFIVNSDCENKISKEGFFKKIEKDYKSSAYTTLIQHEECKNNQAIQIFTKKGPLAFLPCSTKETSIIFSIIDRHQTEKEIKENIIIYNQKYKINSFSKFEKFNLKFSTLRNYYKNNILCFGDNLHKIHPMAGQGFNMTLRDIKIFSSLIDSKLDLGLPLDSSILKDFENNTKHLNYIFSSGINFIHEFFKIDNNFENKFSKIFFKHLGKNNYFNKIATKFADQGIIF